jgi:hypothetical protein
MKIQPPRKSPYDALSKRMLEGSKEQDKLEIEPARGARGTQRRIPRVSPSLAKKSRMT